ncbi:MAG TPA: nitrate- and nitrite sensing domain-containing protein [Streptosporangiaceae bacterium]
MRFRTSRLRIKVTALLVSLTALWAFAAWVTLREGVNLLWVATLDKNIAQPTDPLLVDLQQERRLSVLELVRPGPGIRSALDAQRSRTDRQRATVVRLAVSGGVKRAASRALRQRLGESLDLLHGLDATRSAIDGGTADRGRAVADYSAAIQSIFRVYDSLATLDDKQFGKDTASLLELNEMWEVLSQEDALLAGALASGSMTQAERAQFTEIVGARHFNTDRVLLKIQQFDPVAYARVIRSAKLARVNALEDQVIQSITSSPAGALSQGDQGIGRGTVVRIPVSARDWTAATQPALAELRQTIQAAGDRLVARAKPLAAGAIVRLVLAGGLGLLAVIASIVVSITTARALVSQLEKLRTAALELAERRLPSVVERLGRGDEVDVAAEAPPLEFGRDAIGQVSRAFNAVQETALRSAVEQAELRRGIRDVLLSLARRTQTLVHRQLTLLDRMERREIDTAELEDLFRLDHLATRMRRNAENLIVLSGSTPARGWRRSVPMVDVVRAAVAEIEDYTRVTVLPMGSIALAGRAVGDLTHLLAELIENAVSFSPPPAVVQVSAHFTARGYAIEIEDRGLGIAEDRLEAINARISDPPEFNLSRSVQLGLYVVGRLAQRYGVRVTLKNSAYGGTTAVVLIPGDLLLEGQDDDADFGEIPQAVKGAVVAREPVTVAAGAIGPAAIGSGGDPAGDDPSGDLTGGPAGSERSAAEPQDLPGADEPATIVDAATRAGNRRALPTRTRTTPQRAPGSFGPRPYVSGAGRTDAPSAHPAAANAASTGTGTTGTGTTNMGSTGPGSTGTAAGADGPPEPATPQDELPLTPAGLPFRIPQASLNPALRADRTEGQDASPAGTGEGPRPDDTRRSPEEVRRLVGSYLSGTSRGRSEAARRRTPSEPPAEGSAPSTDDEPQQ